jgi:hypothetical protein
MLQTYIENTNIKVTNYYNPYYLYETVCQDLLNANYLFTTYIEVRITGFAPQRKPFQTWEELDVQKFLSDREAINAGYAHIDVKDCKTCYGY